MARHEAAVPSSPSCGAGRGGSPARFSLLLLSLLLLGHVSVPTRAVAGADHPGVVVEGTVKLDVPVRLKSSAVKLVLDGGDQTAFVRLNGYFQMRVQPGIHFLQVSAVGATFPQVRLDVSVKNRGRVKATIIHDGNVLSTSVDDLTIAPISPEVYFEVRQPLNIWALIKSPMGIMTCVMAFGLVVMPYLMEGIDPEEMKQMQEQMRTQPSLTSMLTGAAPPSGGGRS